MVAGAVDLAEAPLALERLLEALDLAVDLGPAGRDQQVTDALSCEQLGESMVAGVDPGVVADQPGGHDPLFGEGSQRPLNECRHRRRFLVAVQLAVGVAGVVVDKRVHPLVADMHPLLFAAAVPDAGDGVAGTAEADEPFRVDVQQVSGTRPLVQPRPLARLARAA